MQAMPEALVQPAHVMARRCPACHRVSANSERCLHCWRDIAAVSPLSDEEASKAMLVEAGLARRIDGGWLSFGRLWKVVSLGLLVLLVGWWVYATFIDKPPRPDLPSSAARSSAQGAWTTQDGDSRGSRATDAASHIGGTEAWKASLGSPVAVPLVSDGRLVVAALEDGRLVGLDASSGKTAWTKSLNNPPLSAPVIAGDRVYLAQREGLILVLGAADGAEIWHSRFVAGSFEASPLVVDGVVYAYSTDGLFAFDAEDGRILWEQVFEAGWATVTPVVEGKHLVIATADRAVVFDRTNGQRTYYVTFSRTQPSSIAIRDGEVLAVYGRNATLFASNSTRPWWDGFRTAWFRFHLIGMAPAVPPAPTLWDVTTLPKTTLAAAMGPNIAVVTSSDGAITALGRHDGKPAWTAKTSARLVAPPIITADGVLFAEGNRLLLLDVVNGQQRSERKVDGLRSVAPTPDAAFIANGAGEVFAIR
ncbi:MAG: hypothetical protein EPO65_01835 [Dehalococcoidia bacterium]|nr:MAG: hypothetical protein EPO65_01835 [Dehalococcoidia bacterium]